MHISALIYTQTLDPHKKSTCFFLKNEQIYYCVERDPKIQPVSLEIVQKKISELINGELNTRPMRMRNALSRGVRNRDQFVKNVKIINAKIKLHNKRIKKSLIYCILHYFGIEWRIVKMISLASLEQESQKDQYK